MLEVERGKEELVVRSRLYVQSVYSNRKEESRAEQSRVDQSASQSHVKGACDSLRRLSVLN